MKNSCVKFANFVCICIMQEKRYHFCSNFSSTMVTFSTCNTNIYKICKLCRATFSTFYNNLPPNFAILLILDPLSSCGLVDHKSIMQIAHWNLLAGCVFQTNYVEMECLWKLCYIIQAKPNGKTPQNLYLTDSPSHTYEREK